MRLYPRGRSGSNRALPAAFRALPFETRHPGRLQGIEVVQVKVAVPKLALGWVAVVGFGTAPPARAHDLQLPLQQLGADVARVEREIQRIRGNPLGGPIPSDGPDPRRILGTAEIEFALGHPDKALRALWGPLEDPRFRSTSSYIPSLLLASEILERSGDDFGAMALARRALEHGGAPEDMAEAGSRWFRLARRHDRPDGRIEVFRLLKRSGGLDAADPDRASQVRYEAAFALRDRGQLLQARRLVERVPSETRFGSRAAYLTGVLFVQQGDLSNAERWFSALMDWPVPEASTRNRAQLNIEESVRAHAALSAGRLRYEAGRLQAAADAYAKVPRSSSLHREACWELAYLSLEMEKPKLAQRRVRCVEDLGAGGKRRVDAALFDASLLAHLGRYGASLERFDRLRRRFVREHRRVEAALRRVEKPAQFLFENMERSALDGGRLSPGPPTLFQQAWTPHVDRAYRVDRGLDGVRAQVDGLRAELRRYTALLQDTEEFPEVRFRRQTLERLLREIEHLIGHAGELARSTAADRGPWADLTAADAQAARALMDRLRRAREQVRRELDVVAGESRRRTLQAQRELQAIDAELAELGRSAKTLERAAEPWTDAAAEAALNAIRAFLADAAMRAEVGALDTFWVKKQSRTRAIEALIDERKRVERQMEEAATGLEP